MLSEAVKTDEVFSWKRRYAVHRSFHQRKATQFAHLVGTPLQLFSFVKLMTLISFGNATMATGYNLGLAFVAFLALIYCQIHFLIGLGVTLLLAGFWYLASFVLWSPNGYLNALIALAFFLSGVAVQVGIGHKVLQKHDTNLNAEFTEFFRTYDPMIFVLIFFFPFLDIFLPERSPLKNSGRLVST